VVTLVILPILAQNPKDYATTVSNLDTRLINVLHLGLPTPNNVIPAVASDIFKLTALPSVLTVVVVVVVVGAATIVIVLVIWLVNVEVVVVEAMEEEEEEEEEVIDVVMVVELFVTSAVVLITMLEIVKLLK